MGTTILRSVLYRLVLHLSIILFLSTSQVFSQSCTIETPPASSSTITFTNTGVVDVGDGKCSYPYSIARTGTFTGSSRTSFSPSSDNTNGLALTQTGNTDKFISIVGPCSGIAGTVTFVRLNDSGFPTGSACSFALNAVLPVELLTFSAHIKANGAILLKWTTLSELNNKGFEVQRSYDALDWQFISFVKGNGTTSFPVNYHYHDHLPADVEGVYYRLKQMDTDGAFEFSPLIHVAVQPAENPELKIYPNPSRETINIESPGGIGIFYTAAGQPVQEWVLQKGVTNFNISDLPAGSYVLEVELENGGRLNRWVVKVE